MNSMEPGTQCSYKGGKNYEGGILYLKFGILWTECLESDEQIGECNLDGFPQSLIWISRIISRSLAETE